MASNQPAAQSMFENDLKLVLGLLTILEVMTRLLCMTLEVFLRRNFGARYFNLFGCLTIAALTYYVVGLVAFLGPSILLKYYVVAFVIMGTYHQAVTYWRSRYGILWHTRYSGSPFRFWRRLPFATEWNVKRFYEPFACWMVSIVVCSFIDRAFGTYLYLVSFALFITANLEHMRLRTKVLDMIDAEIESQIMGESVVNLKGPAQTNGFYLPGPFPQDIKVRQAMADHFRGSALSAPEAAQELKGEMKQVLDAGEESGDVRRILDAYEGYEPEGNGTPASAAARESLADPAPSGQFLEGISDDPELRAILGSVQPEPTTEARPEEPDHPEGAEAHEGGSEATAVPGWILVFCGPCGRVTGKVRRNSAGKTVKCRACRSPLAVPATLAT